MARTSPPGILSKLRFGALLVLEQNKGSISVSAIDLEMFSPTVEKKLLNSSAISLLSVQICPFMLSSVIFCVVILPLVKLL